MLSLKREGIIFLLVLAVMPKTVLRKLYIQLKRSPRTFLRLSHTEVFSLSHELKLSSTFSCTVACSAFISSSFAAFSLVETEKDESSLLIFVTIGKEESFK